MNRGDEVKAFMRPILDTLHALPLGNFQLEAEWQMDNGDTPRFNSAAASGYDFEALLVAIRSLSPEKWIIRYRGVKIAYNMATHQHDMPWYQEMFSAKD